MNHKNLQYQVLRHICNHICLYLNKHNVEINKLKEEIDNTKNLYLKAKLKDIVTIYEDYQEKINGNYLDDADLLTILAEKIEETNMFKDSLIYMQ